MLFVILSVLLQQSSSPAWKYVVPPAKDTFHHPGLRLLALSPDKPSDLKEETTYRGTSRRYGQFHYGNALSTRVSVVLDDRGNGQFDLYVDTHRHRAIRNEDRLAEGVYSWQIPLDAVITEGTVQTRYPRRVLFQYGKTTRTLAYATCGYMEGQVNADGELLKARRIDGDGNGLFADPQDRLWINLGGYDHWDPVSDQFPFTSVLTIRQQRYVIQADAVGERLQLKPLDGVGRLSISAPKLPSNVSVVAIQATLASKDGILASFNELDKEQTLPIGEYACTSLLLSLQDGQTIWSYLFTADDPKLLAWKKLEKNRSLKMDVVGVPRMEIGLNDNQVTAAGEDLVIQPQLRTGTGLLINTIYYGLDQPFASSIERAKIDCCVKGKSFVSSTSGFA